jgi:hypothetical protein
MTPDALSGVCIKAPNCACVYGGVATRTNLQFNEKNIFEACYCRLQRKTQPVLRLKGCPRLRSLDLVHIHTVVAFVAVIIRIISSGKLKATLLFHAWASYS